ncbi:hypothetical protein IAR55_005119 [Kwoniella newhampshirensis]|uniref:Zinc finger protein 830 n=1 Tax=Kwoniella newhampshirensis TaxID=1651941 RepID=A0AAW0YWN8_9TREE
MDARSLLRAKKAEARISHPYAAYTAAGVLRCSICAVPVKQWDAHLLTKQHRTSVARERAEQEKAKSKRPAEDSGAGGGSGKRARTQVVSQGDDSDNHDEGPTGLPAGFFSSGSRPTAASSSSESQAGPSTSTSPSASNPVSTPAPAPASLTKAKKTGDVELDDFLSSLTEDVENLSAPLAPPPTAAGKRKIATYKEVIPGQASYEAAPVRNVESENSDANGGAGEQTLEEPEETEAERRARLEREEREEIVARLEEEERAQEDADSRVTMLKQRMEMLRKKREAKGVKTKNTA